MRGSGRSEYSEQCAIFNWVKFRSKKIPELDLLYASANGGKRNLTVAVKLKKSGVRAGIPDLTLPIARGGYHALYIELKIKGGSVSKVQKKWIEKLRAQHNKVEVCFGFEEAAMLIEKYLEMPDLEPV